MRMPAQRIGIRRRGFVAAAAAAGHCRQSDRCLGRVPAAAILIQPVHFVMERPGVERGRRLTVRAVVGQIVAIFVSRRISTSERLSRDVGDTSICATLDAPVPRSAALAGTAVVAVPNRHSLQPLAERTGCRPRIPDRQAIPPAHCCFLPAPSDPTLARRTKARW